MGKRRTKAKNKTTDGPVIKVIFIGLLMHTAMIDH